MFKPVIIKTGHGFFQVEFMSIFLNVIGFTALVASMLGDGLVLVGIALLIFIFDAIRFPYPNIEDVTAMMEEQGIDDDDDLDAA